MKRNSPGTLFVSGPIRNERRPVSLGKDTAKPQEPNETEDRNRKGDDPSLTKLHGMISGMGVQDIVGIPDERSGERSGTDDQVVFGFRINRCPAACPFEH